MLFAQSTHKKKLATLAILLLLAGLAYYFYSSNAANSYLVAETCLESGGVWNYTDETCQMDEANSANSEPVRADGDDFDGLAVFPTWSALEPATFPILVDGEARGPWFFEATFPVEIRLNDGVILAEGYAQAQDEWMTTEVVPFYAELKKKDGAPDYVGVAALVLKKANASGLPEHDARFTTQIFIDTTQ